MIDNAIQRLYHDFAVFDGAYHASRTAEAHYGNDAPRMMIDLSRAYADGRVSRKDLQAVIDSEGFTADQKETARYLLQNQEVFDSLDVGGRSGQTDNKVSQADVLGFIDARRPQLSSETMLILEAANILAVGRRNGTDDYDARIIALAEHLEGISDVKLRRELIEEIFHRDPGAYQSWLQSARLRDLGPAGTGKISATALDALQSVIPYAPEQLPRRPAGTVRFATYNIGQGASRGEGRGTDYDEIPTLASNIAKSDADVIGVQEIFEDDVEKLRTELQQAEQERAELEGTTERTVYIEFSNADGSKEIRHEDGRHTFRGGGFGNAVVTYSDSPPVKVYDKKLPDDGDEGRSLLGITTRVDGRPITILTTHISSQPVADNGTDPQSAQINETFDALEEGFTGPVILSGDFNARLGGEGRPSEPVFSRRFAESGFEDAGRNAGPTSEFGHGRRIDYVFTKNMTVEGSYRLDAGTSDHAGVVVDVRIDKLDKG